MGYKVSHQKPTSDEGFSVAVVVPALLIVAPLRQAVALVGAGDVGVKVGRVIGQ